MSDAEDEDKEPKRAFKVEDRRRFSETGDARSDARDEPWDSTTAAPLPSSEPQASRPESSRPETTAIEINFSTFVISLSTQALAHLGEIPDPISNRMEIDLGAAKQMIDILGLLKDKTKGNLDKSEAALMDHVLYDLRLKFVERARAQS